MGALTALMKMRHKYQLQDIDKDEKIDAIFELFDNDKMIEVQQRSIEFLALFENTDQSARNKILKPMPVPKIERLFDESKSAPKSPQMSDDEDDDDESTEESEKSDDNKSDSEVSDDSDKSDSEQSDSTETDSDDSEDSKTKRKRKRKKNKKKRKKKKNQKKTKRRKTRRQLFPYCLDLMNVSP